MRRFALALAFVALVVAPVLAQSRTPRFGAPYTSNESTNQAFDKFDRAPVADATLHLAFCGQQANAGTTYLASLVNDLVGIDTYGRDVGDATCDARGNATEATADVVISPDRPLRIVGFTCEAETAAGASQTNTYRVRAGAADLSPLLGDCIIGGATAIHCSVRSRVLAGPIVAANTPMAVRSINTDNESAVGALCRVFVEVQ